ncbi:MAG: trans-sulfuration enzyme family protein [Egibacteraceae bacterium]
MGAGPRVDATGGERPLGFSTRAIHARAPGPGPDVEPAAVPIWLSSDYLFDGVEHYAELLSGQRSGYAYARFGSPTHTALHQVLASLEDAEAALSFTSGMAAVLTSLTTLAEAGDHIVADRGVYNTTYTLLASFLPRYGVRVTFVAPEAEAVDQAIEPATRAVLIDSITTPTFRVADVAGVAAVCAAREVPLIVDNTIATPYLLRPLDLAGVEVVLHSTSKYIGGHSDLIGGSVAASAELIGRMHELSKQQGTIAGVFDAWLALRGVQTLAIRVERQCATALALAGVLAEHGEVRTVGYSGLAGHPDHQRASKLFGGARFGAMLSLCLRGGYEAAVAFCGALRIARVGSGFGGMRTEVRHPATTSHRFLTQEQRLLMGIDQGLVRVSVGAEDAEDLVEDFVQALDRLNQGKGS